MIAKVRRRSTSAASGERAVSGSIPRTGLFIGAACGGEPRSDQGKSANATLPPNGPEAEDVPGAGGPHAWLCGFGVPRQSFILSKLQGIDRGRQTRPPFLRRLWQFLNVALAR